MIDSISHLEVLSEYYLYFIKPDCIATLFPALTQSGLRGQTVWTPVTSHYLYFQSKLYSSVCVCGPQRVIYQS